MHRFKEALSAPASSERAEKLTRAELGRRFRVTPGEAPEVLARAEKLGVLVPLGDNTYEVPSPSLLAVAEEVARREISLQRALLTIFQQRLSTQIEGAFGEITRRLAERRA